MISERDREVLSRLPVWNPASDIAAQRRAPNARICAGFHYRFSTRVGQEWAATSVKRQHQLFAAGRVLSRDELRHATALRKMGKFSALWCDG
jgi:hypothetical protein